MTGSRDLYSEQLQRPGQAAVNQRRVTEQPLQRHHLSWHDRYQQQQSYDSRLQDRSHCLQMLERPSCVPWKGSQSSITPPGTADFYATRVPAFVTTVVNFDIHFIKWDPHSLSSFLMKS